MKLPNRTGRRWFGLLAFSLLLSACGGGTSQIEPFRAGRMIAFGDEMSAFTADGYNHAVNGLASDSQTLDCNKLPIWTQIVAKIYNFGFAQCPLTGGETKATTRAFAGARAADLPAQVAAQLAEGGIVEKDLVTVLMGVNDVKDLYLQSLPPLSRSEPELIAEVQSRGVAVAREVNALVDRGARVIVATLPDLGLSPWGLEQGSAGAALLSRLTAAFNGRVRVTVLNDGRYIGLVLADEFVQVAAKGFYGFANVKDAACTVPLPACTTATLVSGAGADTWLWADKTWMSTAGHRRLGALAESRARLNPF